MPECILKSFAPLCSCSQLPEPRASETLASWTRLCRATPQLQVPLVAGPRNQRYLQREGLGFWGPLALYGRAEPRRQVPFQFDSEPWPAEARVLVGTRRRLAVSWRQGDRVDEPLQRLSGFRTRFRLLQGVSQARHLVAVLLGHLGMQKRWRRVRGSELRLQHLAPGRVRCDLVLHC